MKKSFIGYTKENWYKHIFWRLFYEKEDLLIIDSIYRDYDEKCGYIKKVKITIEDITCGGAQN